MANEINETIETESKRDLSDAEVTQFVEMVMNGSRAAEDFQTKRQEREFDKRFGSRSQER